MRFAREEAIIQEKYVCRNCTEQLFSEIEEEHIQLMRDLQILEQEIAMLKRLSEQA